MKNSLTNEDIRKWLLELNERTMELEMNIREIIEKYGDQEIGFIWEKENA